MSAARARRSEVKEWPVVCRAVVKAWRARVWVWVWGWEGGWEEERGKVEVEEEGFGVEVGKGAVEAVEAEVEVEGKRRGGDVVEDIEGGRRGWIWMGVSVLSM